MRWQWKFLICTALVVSVWVTFGRACRYGFVDFDDTDYIRYLNARPAGLTAENIRWAFTAYTFSNWHPLTWISYLVDREIFSNRPAAMHAENIWLHAFSSALLFLVLENSTGKRWRSCIVAALFALHPMHVESVAWISERKDTLSIFFLFVAWLIYIDYARRPAIWRYGLVTLALGASLLSKPTGVTFPFCLLLWDIWPLRRQMLPRIVLEKLPLFAMSIFTCILTFRAQRFGHSVASLVHITLAMRLENAAVAYVRYLLMLLVPMNLAAFYPFRMPIPVIQVLAASLALVWTTVMVVRLRKQKPYLVVGWLWYLGTFLPMIGLIQVGKQAMADRYSYLPSVGIFIAAVWILANLIPAIFLAAGLSCAIASAVIATYGSLSFIQVGYWKDTETLFRHAMTSTDDNWTAISRVGILEAKRGNYTEAIEYFTRSIQINPADAETYYSLGNCIYLADPEKAIPLYEKAIELSPDDPNGHFNLGDAFFATHRIAEAEAQYRRAWELNPDFVEARRQMEVSQRLMQSR